MLTNFQYADVEAKYMDAITTVLHQNQVNTMIVEKLEKQFPASTLKKMLGRYDLQFTQSDAEFVSQIKNGLRLDMAEIKKTIMLVLRECFWCELLSETEEVKIEFGYDYYVYLQGVSVDASTISSFRSEGIYIELL